MKTSPYFALFALLALLCAGCEPTLVTPTQVLVTVHSDLGAALSRVETAVYDVREQQASDVQTYAVPAEVTLPFSFAIVPAAEQPASTVLVVVTGRDAQGALLAQSKALVRFREHERIGIEVSLLAACLLQECGALQTCTVSQTNVASCGVVEEPPVKPLDRETMMSSAADAAGDGASSPPPSDAESAEAAREGGPLGANDAGSTMPDAGGGATASGAAGRDAGASDAGTSPRDASSQGLDASEAGAKDATVQDAGSQPEASTGDAASPVNPFPRLDQAATIAMTGPYAVASYTDGLDNASYGSPIVYYPTNATPPFAAVAVMQGYLNMRSIMMAWGPFLASHGIVSMFVETTATGDGVPERADDLDAQLSTLRAENTRSGGPLRGKLDTSRLGLFGFSMGGAGALVSANRNRTQVRAVVAFEPWISGASGMMSFPQITAPTLVFGGAGDVLAPPATYARVFYASISAAKAYFEIAEIGHVSPPVTETGPTRMILAWLKIYLEGDTRYETYISGSKRFENTEITVAEGANR